MHQRSKNSKLGGLLSIIRMSAKPKNRVYFLAKYSQNLEKGVLFPKLFREKNPNCVSKCVDVHEE